MKTLLTIAIKTSAAITAGLFLLLFTSLIHVASRPMEAHAMDGGHHGSTNVACATLCSAAIVKREDAIKHVEEEQDDNIQPAPFQPQLGRVFFESLYPTGFPTYAPPSKIPLYKLHGVLLS